MTTKLNDKIESMPAPEQTKIVTRAKEIAEQMGKIYHVFSDDSNKVIVWNFNSLKEAEALASTRTDLRVICGNCNGSGYDKGHTYPNGDYAACESCYGFGKPTEDLV